MPEPRSKRLIQFTHLAKLLRALPGADTLSPASHARLYGTSDDAYAAVLGHFDAAVDDAARRLAERAADQFAALPFAEGEVIVAAGDSITDDLQSWAHILRRALGIDLVEGGVSGDTTTHLLSRFAHVAACAPDWLLILIGTNDARRHGPDPAGPLVSDDAFRRNLDAIRRYAAARTSARLVWITPPPVIESRIAVATNLVEDEVTWLDHEVAGKADIVRAQPEPVVDLGPVFDADRLPGLLLPDGLHPSLEGQLEIATAVVRTLADGP